MPSRQLPLLYPRDVAEGLGLPARDLLRGARRALTGPLRLLEPVGAHVPRRLRDRLDEIGAQFGRRVSGAADLAGLMAPPVFTLNGGESAAAARFARIAYFGLTQALSGFGRDDLAASETLAGYSFARTALHSLPDDAAATRAAATGIALLAHHAIGVVPGTPIGLDDDAAATIRLAVFAVMLWLLAERAPDGDGERDVLRLCGAVALAQRQAVVDAGDHVADVAALLETNAAMI